MLTQVGARRWAAFLVALLLGAAPLAAHAAGPRVAPTPGQSQLSLRALGLAQGLPHNSVYGITRDRFGFVWFGTLEGLARFDGYRFTVFQPDPLNPDTPSSGQIFALYADSAGVVWAGTLASGLNSFDPRTERFTRYRHDPDDATSLSSDAIRSIYEDRAGALWVGTLDGGLNRLDRATGRFTQFRHDPTDPSSLSHNRVQAIGEDGQGGLWVGTFGGLDRLDLATGRFAHFRHHPARPESLGGDQVYALLAEPSGVVWVGVYGAGLYRYDPAGGGFTTYRHDPADPSSLGSDNVVAIAHAAAGGVWVATYGGGLNRLDPATGRFERFERTVPLDAGLPSNSLVTLFSGADGLLWAGTEDQGALAISEQPSPFTRWRPGPDDQARPDMLRPGTVRAAVEDVDGALWLGISGAGLDRLDRQSGVVTHYQHRPDDPGSPLGNWPQALLVDRDGALWIGYSNGLDRYDRASGRFVHFQHDPDDPASLSANDVFDLYEDRGGALWIAVRGGGLSRLDRATGRFTHFRHDPADPASLPSNAVTTVAEDAAGNLWVGTEAAGLGRLDRATGRFTHFRHDPADPASPGSNAIAALHLDPRGTLWAATWNSGLARFDPASGGFAHFRVADGLLSGKLNGIQSDADGYLWLTSNQGLTKFDPRSGHSTNYTSISDDLPPGGFPLNGSATTRGGELLLGTFAGLVTLSPAQILPRAEVAPVVFTDVLLANQPVRIGPEAPLASAINATDALTLSYRDRVVSFGFAALEFSFPQAVRYRYRLTGFDREWVEVGPERRSATYTNLDPGSYRFEVMAANADWVWGTQTRSIELTVVPPWWQTWWFTLLALVVAVASGVGAVRLRLRGLRAQQRRLEAEVAARTAELDRQLQLEQELMMTPDPQVFLGRILEAIRQVVDCSSAVVLSADDELLTLRAINSDYLRLTTPGLQLELQRIPLLARALRAAIPQVVATSGDDQAMLGYLEERLGQRPRGRTWLVAPLLVKGLPIGILLLAHSAPDAYGATEVRLLTPFISPVALALENARLQRNAQRAAVIEERHHLARELHDAVTQTLFSATLIAEALPEALRASPERAAAGADELRRLTTGALAEMRTLLLELRPKALNEKSFGSLLKLLCSSVSGRSAIAVNCETTHDCILDPPVQLVFYRVAQEALNNVMKHAEAGEVAVSFDGMGGAPMLRVTDDGRGFVVASMEAGASGLRMMQERAAEIGAQLTITSEPGQGTSLELRWDAHEAASRQPQ